LIEILSGVLRSHRAGVGERGAIISESMRSRRRGISRCRLQRQIFMQFIIKEEVLRGAGKGKRGKRGSSAEGRFKKEGRKPSSGGERHLTESSAK